jgi:hypothetical protein
LPPNGEYATPIGEQPTTREQLRLALALWDLSPSFTDREFDEKCIQSDINPERLQELLDERMIELGRGAGTADSFGTLSRYSLTPKGRIFVKQHLPKTVRARVRRREMFRSTGLAMIAPVAIGIRGLPVVLRHTLGRFGDTPCHIAAIVTLVALSAIGVNWQLWLDPWVRRRR